LARSVALLDAPTLRRGLDLACAGLPGPGLTAPTPRSSHLVDSPSASLTTTMAVTRSTPWIAIRHNEANARFSWSR